METPTPTRSLQGAREHTIDVLCREFANDILTLPELERRLARAREARTPEDLRALVADLSPLSAPVPAPPDATRTTPGPTRSRERTGERSRGSHLAFAVIGGHAEGGEVGAAGEHAGGGDHGRVRAGGGL